MKRAVRVSSSVDLTPNRAATMACTMTSGCSSRALNSSSFLAKAYVSLPVVRLILRGGVTPRLSKTPASLGLLIKSSFSINILFIRCSLVSLTAFRCTSSTSLFNSSTGSLNIRMVRSISFNSDLSKSCENIWNSLSVNSASFLQYSPYCAMSAAVKSVRFLPNAATTSLPFSPML